MPIRYTCDRLLGWIVLIGDCVIEFCNSEEECKQLIENCPEGLKS